LIEILVVGFFIVGGATGGQHRKRHIQEQQPERPGELSYFHPGKLADFPAGWLWGKTRTRKLTEQMWRWAARIFGFWRGFRKRQRPLPALNAPLRWSNSGMDFLRPISMPNWGRHGSRPSQTKCGKDAFHRVPLSPQVGTLRCGVRSEGSGTREFPIPLWRPHTGKDAFHRVPLSPQVGTLRCSVRSEGSGTLISV